MGMIYYDDQEPVVVDDELLEHLAAIITLRFRRNESVVLSWGGSGDARSQRSTFWLTPAVPSRFVFDSPSPVGLHRAVLNHLMSEAGSNAGIVLEDLQHLPAIAAVSERVTS